MKNYKARLPKHNLNVSNSSPMNRFLKYAGGAIVLALMIMFLINYSAKYIVHFIPPKWEQEIMSFRVPWNFGDEVFGKAYEKEGKTHAPVEVVQKLVKRLNKNYENHRDSYKIKSGLICQKDPNAFAAPGGYVFATTSLVNALASENGLAFIMAHELGHTHLRHNSEAYLSNIFTGVFTQLLNIENTQKYFESISGVVRLKFSRDAERAADKFAIELVMKEYGHARGADEFFNWIKKEESLLGGSVDTLGFLSTHPATDDRLEFIRSFVNENEKIYLKPLSIEKNSLDEMCNPRKTI